MTNELLVPELKKLTGRPGKRPYKIELPGKGVRIYCSVEELQALADQLNDELDNIVQ